MSHSKHVHIKRSDVIEITPMMRFKEAAIMTGTNLIALASVLVFVAGVAVVSLI
jgi:hypothetical protein